MIRIPHELPEEFPQDAQTVEQLARSDRDFGELASSYNEINQNIYLIESEEQPTTDEVLEKLKKRRLKLKDEIADFLRMRAGRA